MALDDWPESDRKWAARYILCLAVKQDVRLEASQVRQAELIEAVQSSGVSAAELFGDPDEAAEADGPELRTIGGAASVSRHSGRDYSDDEWFRRLRRALRWGGVSKNAIDEHERSLRADLTTSALEEYGPPDVIAQELVAADPAARRRRWMWTWSAVVAIGLIMVLGLLASFVSEGWSVQSISLLVMCVVLAPSAAKVWRSRSKSGGA